MGAGSGNVLFLVHRLHVSGELQAQDGQITWHFGNHSIDLQSPSFSRAALLDLAAATGSAGAFDAAMAGTSGATWYADCTAAATNASITGAARPENLIRKVVANTVLDFAV